MKTEYRQTIDNISGESRPEAIAEAVTASSIIVVIFSANSNESKDVVTELTLADNAGLVIIPLRINDVEPQGA